jgi:rSAM/selenodomain-associated transferase 2/rSAM/selenodomain-associated transferase 1
MLRETTAERTIVFGRYPVPGKVKTRLIPALGRAGAAAIQKQLTEATLRTVKKFAASSEVETEFCFEGGDTERAQRWLGRGPLFSQQEQGDLGARMGAAFLKAFRDGCRKVVLVGTDIPDLRQAHLQEAFEGLRDNDVVIGPSTDGGYWLIGMNRPLDVFGGVEWGSDGVLHQTLSVANSKGLKYRLLGPLLDIDTVEDLREWIPEMVRKRPYLSVIIPTLNEIISIAGSLARARDPDAEIIVVDGGSTDRTRDKARDAGAMVIESGKGRAFQQSTGARAARGKILLFLHADTRLPPAYVDHVFETLLPKRTVAGAFCFKVDRRIPLIGAVEWMANVRSRVFQLPYGDQALFMERSQFDAAGGFPGYPIAEDFFLVRRLRKHGRIRIAEAEAITSGRRWQHLGVVRTTLINWLILAGCYLGVSPGAMAPLYRVPGREKRR